METSRLSYTKKLLRYLTRTLNPNHTYHSHTKNSISPSGCVSDFDIASKNLREPSCLLISSSGSSSNGCNNSSLHDSSIGLSSKCNLDSSQQSKKKSLCNSSSYGSYSIWFLKHRTMLNIYRSRRLVSSNVGLIKACYGGTFRFFSASSDGKSVMFDEGTEHEEVNTCDVDSFLGESKQNDVRAKKKRFMPPLMISEIVSITKSNEDDLETKLSSLAKKLCVRSAAEVFEALNREEVSGMRFFRWVHRTNPALCRSSEFCSLIVNNCGWLNDYGTMVSMLREFESQNICLTKEAFGFVTRFGKSKASARECIKGVVQSLNGVGGSCRSSGICAMIQLFCALGLFGMAKFVMEVTERTVPRYNILIREMCRRSRIEEAFGVIEEMRQVGCRADARTYNLILGRLCKIDRLDEACNLLEAMKEKGTPPDALSFEILIDFSGRLGKFDHAYRYLDEMVSWGLQPRFTIHVAIIKAHVKANQHEEAYKYVKDSSLKEPVSSPMIYTLLANLHQKNGDLLSARSIILEMMHKGLKPNFNVYMDLVGRLQRSGKAFLAEDLRKGYARFTMVSHTQNSN